MPGNVLDQPLITVVIPTYQRPKRLKRAVCSVLNQTSEHYKVCIYDNNSQDDTESVAKALMAFDSRVEYVRHVENIGPIQNHIIGIQRVSTPYFVVLCDDDYFLPDFFEDALNYLESNSDISFYAGKTIVVEEAENKADKPIMTNPKGFTTRVYNTPEGFYALLDCHIAWHAIVFRSSLIEDFAAVNPETNSLLEWDFEFLLAKKYPYYYTDKESFVFVDHAEEYFSKDVKAYKKHLDLLNLIVSHLCHRDMTRTMQERFGRWARTNFVRTLKKSRSCFSSRHEFFDQAFLDAYRIIGQSNLGIVDAFSFFLLVFVHAHPWAKPIRAMIQIPRIWNQTQRTDNRFGEYIEAADYNKIIGDTLSDIRALSKKIG